MNKTMDMTIATPEGIVFEGKVESAKFPGTLGAFTVLPRHAALISALTEGKISYIQEGQTTDMPILRQNKEGIKKSMLRSLIIREKK